MVAIVKNNCIIIHKLNLPSTFALALPVTAEHNGNTYPDGRKYKGLFQYLFVAEQHHPFPETFESMFVLYVVLYTLCIH